MKYQQVSKKISYSNNEEFVQKISELRAVKDMPITIDNTIPDATDTKHWCIINYYIVIQ